MTQKISICIVGGGQIGERHMEVAALSPYVDLAAVVEPYEPKRKELADQGLPVFADIADVPDHVSAAVIATPTPTHASAAIQAIGRGWGVIVEKPLAGTLDEARGVLEAADRAGVPLFTGHHRRCHPFSIAARERIAAVGDLVGVQALWSLRKQDAYFDVPWRRQPGAGPLLQNLSHELDLMQFILGPVVEVSAMVSSSSRKFEIEDTSAVSLRFANGALGSVLISDAGASPWGFEAATGENPMLAASGQDYLRVVGTKGGLEFPSLRHWTNTEGGETEWCKPLTPSAPMVFGKIDPLLEQMNRFAQVISTGQPDDILCTGRDGLAALEMTLATALSGKTGRPVCKGEVAGDFNGV